MDGPLVLLPAAPAWVSLGDDLMATAQATRQRSQSGWIVTVGVSASTGASAFDAPAVSAQLRDSNGAEIAPLGRAAPSGPQIGEGLRVVTEIIFEFEGSARPPLDLQVAYREHQARFRLDEPPARP